MNAMEQNNASAVTAFIADAANRDILERTEQFFTGQFLEAFTDRRFAVDDIFVKGEQVIARIVMEGTHSGNFIDNAPTGRTVKATQFREFRVVDGSIAEHCGWYDTGTLLPQIQTR
jgi:predicted ester cyclase